jgi:hypothetical protein
MGSESLHINRFTYGFVMGFLVKYVYFCLTHDKPLCLELNQYETHKNTHY